MDEIPEGIIDYGFNFEEHSLDVDGLDFSADFLEENNNRYINPKPDKVSAKFVKFEYAMQAAEAIDLTTRSRSHLLISGNFESGDFIEAVMVKKNIRAKLSISTLSMSRNNVDSLVNLIEGGYVESLELIVSDYFFSHERNQLVPYILKELDIADRFDFAVAGSHTKIALMETFGGHKVVIHGSANLRSSGCVEQLTIEETPELYDFYKDYHNRIIREYSIINKSVRREQLWQAVAQSEEENQEVQQRKAGRARASGTRHSLRFKAADLQ
jgi:hypothetical protein